MNKYVKKILLSLLKKRIMKPMRALLSFRNRCRFERSLKRKRENKRTSDYRIIIMATPCHGNLGDHAIVYAEYELLKKFGYRENIIEISNYEYNEYKTIINKYICENDIIIIDGGGNLGTLWPCEDDKISEIIDTYKNNRIIIFPQTCYYDDSEDAAMRLERNREIYKKAKKLVITLRDRKSYEFCCKNFENIDFRFMPDVVLSISYNNACDRENKCLLCLREDLEKVLTDEKRKDIREALERNGIGYEKISTIYPVNISRSDRNERLNEIWNAISKSRLLITDRLHGMIFAAITGTPCLALDNKSKKVSGVYEWISKLDYIKVCGSVEEMIYYIPKFYNLGYQEYACDFVCGKFNELKSLFSTDNF